MIIIKDVMKKLSAILVPLLLLSVISCNQLFEEHYKAAPETIDRSIWESIRANPDYSSFVALFEELGLDSIFQQEGAYTIFVPNNEAFSTFNPDSVGVSALLNYHVLGFLFNVVDVEEAKSIQTLDGKLARIEYHNGIYTYDGSAIVWTSPLHRDGQYYEPDEILNSKSTLYEYLDLHCKVMREYVDGFDSILMDLENSIPIAFDEDGNTIYDSVYTVANFFDSLYYPLKEEHRTRTATFLLFTDEQYAQALDYMAEDMGGAITGAEVPRSWQKNVLMPELVASGLFPNSLYYEDFLLGELRNIVGDTVEVDHTVINPEVRTLCSNGVTFAYTDFKVPRHLYKGEIWIEGEHMVDSVADQFYVWKPEFKVSGSQGAVNAIPQRSFVDGVRNDSALVLNFPSFSYTGEFTLEFNFNEMFPQEYLFIWAGNNKPSGVFEVYANGEQIRSFDTFNWRKAVQSVIPGGYYLNTGNYNRFDALITNATEYGKINIQLKYTEPGFGKTNGMVIDYIALIPTDVVVF